MSNFYFITSNANKVIELNNKLSELNSAIKITNIKIDLTEIQGDPDSIVKAKLTEALNIVEKEQLIAKPYNLMIEDTSLTFNALKTLPGPYIKDFLAIGVDKLPRILQGFEDKSAVARCMISYVNSEERIPHTVCGECPGSIVEQDGVPGFGWDVVFKPDGQDVTFSKMDKGLKNSISHRGRAIEKFVQQINYECQLVN